MSVPVAVACVRIIFRGRHLNGDIIKMATSVTRGESKIYGSNPYISIRSLGVLGTLVMAYWPFVTLVAARH